MKRLFLICLFAVMSTGVWAQDCIVADPTGTPLNIRASPNGAIVGALHNGAAVRMLDMTFDARGRRWAYVVPLGPGRRGWVFREFLLCR